MNDTATQSQRQGHLVSTRVMLIAAGIFIVIAAVLYYVGMTQGRRELAAQKTHYEQQLAQIDQSLNTTRDELAAVRNHNHLMQARVALYRTTIDLDQRNFGIASTRLHDAADALGQIRKDTGGIDLAKIAALKDAIGASDFTVAADLETQRANVLGFATQLDAIAGDAGADNVN